MDEVEDQAGGIDRIPMLFATTVLKPPPSRIGKLNNFVLPRTVELQSVVGATVGGVVGILVGIVLNMLPLIGLSGFFPVLASMIVCGSTGMLLIQWQPWQGESLGRVISTKLATAKSAKLAICPGTGLPVRYDSYLGVEVCLECRVVCATDEGFAKPHKWRRRVFVGLMEVPSPESGVSRWASGSVPVRKPIEIDLK